MTTGEAGFEAELLAVAEEVDVTVAESLVRIARERDAQAVVVVRQPQQD